SSDLGASRVELADANLANVLRDPHWANRGRYGVRKLWHAAHRAGQHLGQDQVGRLMAITGIVRCPAGHPPHTTRTPDVQYTSIAFTEARLAGSIGNSAVAYLPQTEYEQRSRAQHPARRPRSDLATVPIKLRTAHFLPQPACARSCRSRFILRNMRQGVVHIRAKGEEAGRGGVR